MGWKSWPPGGCTNCGCTPAGGGGPGNYTGCACQGTAASLSVAVTYASGETAATYLHQYQDAALVWYTLVGSDVPPYLAPASYSGVGYYSSTTWFDDFGQSCYYRLLCNSSQYSISLGVFSGPSHNIGTVRSWNVVPPNACIPFSMTSGFRPSGVSAPRLDVIG
jgi:hypothetical protein